MGNIHDIIFFLYVGTSEVSALPLGNTGRT
jgi:hypothetical protein